MGVPEHDERMVLTMIYRFVWEDGREHNYEIEGGREKVEDFVRYYEEYDMPLPLFIEEVSND